jgi:hypothetical protein
MRAMVEDFHIKKPLISSKRSMEKSYTSFTEMHNENKKLSMPPLPNTRGNKILQIIGAKTV